MTVIDLGEPRDGAPPGPAPRPPRAVGRPFRLLVVLLLVGVPDTAIDDGLAVLDRDDGRLIADLAGWRPILLVCRRPGGDHMVWRLT
ncbi:hypothetical protein O7622_12445 [Micromonospora sp. WMMD1076]|uniref:hypothetical protein n=1 Tax=Micromonospora TaxID=1873 RepID=UPI00249C4946|nr:hypothetical protein [Micromonospora sp. WMMD1076]WFF09302.1 hypothetical protein O7622_12445 [Micromonospora sp. WMMD1076]